MLVRLIQKLGIYTKEVVETIIFGLLSNFPLYSMLSTTPIMHVILPSLGIVMTILAIINMYQLAKSKNRNFDQWASCIISIVCSALVSAAMYGSVIAAVSDLTFAAAPWLFLASTIVTLTYQSVMLGINAHRMRESAPGSAQRMHYIQAIFNHVFNIGLNSAVIGTLIFVMILPTLAPAVGSVLALIAASFLIANIAWKVLPHNWKVYLKKLMLLDKPEPKRVDESITEPALTPVEDNVAPTHCPRIFTSPDHSAIVKERSLAEAKDYLDQTITKKMATIYTLPTPPPDKISQKISCLSDIQSALTHHKSIHKGSLSKKYPLAFQNFWSEKSDVEQLVDATQFVIGQYEKIYSDNKPVFSIEEVPEGCSLKA